MSVSPAPATADDFRRWSTQIEVCSDECAQLSDWESNFIESVSDQLTRLGSLTRKQSEILQRIYDKVA